MSSGVFVSIGVGVGEVEGVGFGVGVGVGEGEGVGVSEGVGSGRETFRPLLQTNFLPDLMQVYFKPLTVDVVPIFLQALPCLTAPQALFVIKRDPLTMAIKKLCLIRMPKGNAGPWSESMTETAVLLAQDVN